MDSSFSEKDLTKMDEKVSQKTFQGRDRQNGLHNQEVVKPSPLTSSSFNKSLDESLTKKKAEKISFFSRLKHRKQFDGRRLHANEKKISLSKTNDECGNMNLEPNTGEENFSDNQRKNDTTKKENKFENKTLESGSETSDFEPSSFERSKSPKFRDSERGNLSDGVFSDGSDVLLHDRKFALFKTGGLKEFSKSIKEDDEKAEDVIEAKRQDRNIENLCEVIKQTADALFIVKKQEELEQSLTSSSNSKGNSDRSSIQQMYDAAIGEIYRVWMDAVSLIKTVKDHTHLYMDDKSKTVDREQLTLETEMIHLAVDFAVNYSKLKTDFLLKGVQKHLQIKDWEKSELENFMDSKMIPAVYGTEDLFTMAKTVRELNISVLRGEDSEVE